MSTSGGVISKPVSISDIKNTINSQSNNLRELSTSGLINPKAKYKPVSLLLTREIYDNDRLAINYGHSYPTTWGTMLDMLKAYANQEACFAYQKPGSNYRELDFNGYNHNAGNWFSSIAQNPTLAQNSTAPFRIQLQYADIANYIQSVQPARFYDKDFGFFLLTSAPSTGLQESSIYGFYKVTSIVRGVYLPDLITSYDNKIPIFPARLAVGTYYIIPCFTSYNPNTEAGTLISRAAMKELSWGSYSWFLYPFCTIGTITVTSSGGGEQELLDNISFDIVEVQTELRGYLSYRMNVLTLDVYNDNSSPANLSLILNSVEVDNTVGSGTLAQGLSVTVPANGTAQVEVVKEKEGEGYVDFTLASSDTSISINFKKSGGTVTANAQLAYDPEK